MKKPVWIILISILLLSAIGFIYTFVQPRYTATILSVGRARTVTTSNKHGRRSHTIVPLTVTYTDEDAKQQTAEVIYSRPEEPLLAGQQIVITRSFNGFINYPFIGLRWFSGAVGGGIGVFLLFMWMDTKRSSSRGRTPQKESQP